MIEHDDHPKKLMEMNLDTGIVENYDATFWTIIRDNASIIRLLKPLLIVCDIFRFQKFAIKYNSRKILNFNLILKYNENFKMNFLGMTTRKYDTVNAYAVYPSPLAKRERRHLIKYPGGIES